MTEINSLDNDSLNNDSLNSEENSKRSLRKRRTRSNLDHYNSLATISSVTASVYLSVARKLERDARIAIQFDFPSSFAADKPISSMQLVAWFLDAKAATIAACTFRLYKAAIHYMLIQAGVNNNSETELEAAAYLMDYAYVKPKKRLPKRNSSIKAKQVSLDSLSKLTDACLESKSAYSLLAGLWLQAQYHCGLRPNEWFGAILIELEGEPYLKVKNTKRTNNRSHGEFRHLGLAHLSAYDLHGIEDLLLTLGPLTEKSSPTKVYGETRKLILNCNRKVFDNRRKTISLYSLRHQFSSNTKQKVSLIEVAALMGHKTNRTAEVYYGKRSNGHHLSGSIKAMPSEVIKIKIIPKSPNKRLEQLDKQLKSNEESE